MHYRTYDPEKDKDNVRRIWQETGWLEKGKEEIMDTFIAAGKAIVADLDGEPECLVLSAPGTMRYLDGTLTLCAIAAVTTSRVARKQALARRLTAQAIANDVADEGAQVASLRMFEQGYYNQIGFGTGGYEHWLGFDPAELHVLRRARVPRRLKVEDAAKIHAARLARKQGHGACNLPMLMTKGDLLWTDNGFGLGYYDGPQGALTHCLWAGAKDVQHGPYEISLMLYQSGEQFLELMALLKNLGDQVRLVKMREPRDIQLQDLIVQPFKQRQMTQNSPFAAYMRASAYSQMRICDLQACLARTRLHVDSVRFNLALSDPIAACLDGKSPWRGVGGDYVVTLGPSSGAERGTDAALPTLTASVGAFTRLWLGVRPASGLAITDDLSAPPALLDQLDRVLRLPEPKPDWDF